jgi:hypothetical protein
MAGVAEKRCCSWVFLATYCWFWVVVRKTGEKVPPFLSGAWDSQTGERKRILLEDFRSGPSESGIVHATIFGISRPTGEVAASDIGKVRPWKIHNCGPTTWRREELFIPSNATSLASRPLLLQGFVQQRERSRCH